MSRNVAKARTRGQPRFLHVVRSTRGNGFSLVVAHRIDHFTQGAISALSCAQRLGTHKISMFFVGSNVGATAGSNRLQLAVVSSVTRSRDHGVSRHIGTKRGVDQRGRILCNDKGVLKCHERGKACIPSPSRTRAMELVFRVCSAKRGKLIGVMGRLCHLNQLSTNNRIS